MTACEVRCSRCGSVYVVPESFSEKLEQDRLTRWLAEHECRRPHRLTDIPDADGPERYQCDCGRRFRFRDDADDSSCNLVPLPLDAP